MSRRFYSGVIYVLSALIGIFAFAYPFLRQDPTPVSAAQRLSAPLLSTPLLTAVLLVACLAALLIEMQGKTINARVVAALGMMVAAASVLRFLETAIPGPGGFSPIFVPIILAGYVFGVRFGFLMGTFTLLVSALITGGIGPWLPYQMFVAGWVGFTAGCLPQIGEQRLELAMLVAVGVLWGLLFGFITNLYFWPFFAGELHLTWQPGQGFWAGLQRYLAFYAATSLIWDVVRAAGNALVLAALGLPTVRALVRFRQRFHFELQAVQQGR